MDTSGNFPAVCHISGSDFLGGKWTNKTAFMVVKYILQYCNIDFTVIVVIIYRVFPILLTDTSSVNGHVWHLTRCCHTQGSGFLCSLVVQWLWRASRGDVEQLSARTMACVHSLVIVADYLCSVVGRHTPSPLLPTHKLLCLSLLKPCFALPHSLTFVNPLSTTIYNGLAFDLTF